MKYVCLLYLMIFGGLTSCVERVADFRAILPEKEYNVEVAKDVEVLYSDSARITVRITGPVSHRYVYKFKVEEEFPEGVHVEFYGPAGEITSVLDAEYAIRKPSERQVIVRNNVVLKNIKGDTLSTNELIWNERDGVIYTERFVRITRPDELIYSRGFRTNERFERYELQTVEGDLMLEEMFEEEEHKPTPSRIEDL